MEIHEGIDGYQIQYGRSNSLTQSSQKCIQRRFGGRYTQQETEQRLEQYLHPVEGCRHIQYQVRCCKTRSSVTGVVSRK